MKGDLVGPSPGGEHNHILTGNPKSVICGKFRPSGWPEPKEGAALCGRCNSKWSPSPDSRPLPDNWRNVRPPHDEYAEYKWSKGTRKWVP